jgi:hypothetical protein
MAAAAIAAAAAAAAATCNHGDESASKLITEALPTSPHTRIRLATLADIPALKAMEQELVVRCSILSRMLHSRMPLDPTPLLRLKLLQACDH